MPDMHYENLHGWQEGAVICGVDEVGRGPLAGPVFAAAVILPPQGLPAQVQAQIRDSKRLSAKQREHLFPLIQSLSRSYAIAQASVQEIDKVNILQASMLAMRRAVEALGVAPDKALVDGNRAPALPCAAIPIVKGDDKSLSIAAASILAKVARDALMKALDRQYPGYGWAKNAGYGTGQHLNALRTLGVTPWHRTSFAPVLQACQLAVGAQTGTQTGAQEDQALKAAEKSEAA